MRSKWPGITLALCLLFTAGAGQTEDALDVIAFGSCNHHDQDQDFWEPIMAEAPGLFLFLGDNVYGDDDDADLPTLRAAYDWLASLDGYKALRRSVPIMATWDDHDYGKNDAGRSYAHREASEALFEDFWQFPADADLRQRPGVYHARTLGPEGRRVQIIMLDTRFFRSALKRGSGGPTDKYRANYDPTATMLGDEQWQWLAAQLQEPADLRIIASSIQVIADGHGWERWGTMPLERQRLYDLLGRSSEPVVIVSGDRHRGALYRRDGLGSRALHEVTSSSLNYSFPGTERGPHRIGDMVGDNNYGVIRIDWPSRRFTLELKTTEGELAQSLPVSF